MLTDIQIRKTKLTDKRQRLSDSHGLYLLVNPNGCKWWRLDYAINGNRKTLSLGTYPNVTLSDVRNKATEARQQVAKGIDPSDTRKAAKQKIKTAIDTKKRIDAGLPVLNSFEAIALEWYEKNMATKSGSYQLIVKSHLRRDLNPIIGKLPLADITPDQLLEALRLCELRGAATAHRVCKIAELVFQYGIPNICKYNVATDIKHKLGKKPKALHHPAITDPVELSKLLRDLDSYSGSFVVRSALQLAPLVFVRPSELIRAQWQHINLEAEEWRYLVTKTNIEHIVPLSKQAIEILSNLKPLTGNSRYVFSITNNEHITKETLSLALARMDYKDRHTPHGFRATARTILDEVLHFRPDFIEHQLAHAVRDPNGRAYNRTAHLPERKKMMQSWADYLDSLKNGAEVIPFKQVV